MEAAFLLVEAALVPFAALLAALADVRDPRRRQGQRYSMRHLLLFSVLAVLTGATSYQGIITFIALQRERLNTVFGASFRRAPAVNTLRHLFLTLGRDDFEAAFRRHARALNTRTPEAMRTIALDGKTLRGSFDHLTIAQRLTCSAPSPVMPPSSWRTRTWPVRRTRSRRCRG